MHTPTFASTVMTLSSQLLRLTADSTPTATPMTNPMISGQQTDVESYRDAVGEVAGDGHLRQ